MFWFAPTHYSDEEETEVSGDENYLRGAFVLPTVIIVIINWDDQYFKSSFAGTITT